METSEQPILVGFEAASLCSQPECPASLRVWPGSGEAAKMTVGSGRQCSMLLSESSPLGVFSKILLGSSRWANSTESCYAWQRLDTRFALSAFQLQRLEPTTSDTESSLWPTQDAKLLIPTPIERDYRSGSMTPRDRTAGPTLAEWSGG